MSRSVTFAMMASVILASEYHAPVRLGLDRETRKGLRKIASNAPTQKRAKVKAARKQRHAK